jgi:hypothetical protein
MDEAQRSHIVLCFTTSKGSVRYDYISIIDRLRGFYSNGYLSQKLDYRQSRRVDPAKSEDVFDGEGFKNLSARNVTWYEKDYRSSKRYFDKPTDLALGLSTDGIPLQKHTRLDTWPLLVTVYSLPPELRYRREFQLCCGLIPGTCFVTRMKLQHSLMHGSSSNHAKGSKDDREGKVKFETFLWPLMKELEILATTGVECRKFVPSTGTLSTVFNLRAHLITVTGDMPAVSKVGQF